MGTCLLFKSCKQTFITMAPMKAKAMKSSKPLMTKTGLADAIATAHELKKSEAAKILNTLATVATKEVKNAGKFTIPGLCMIKTREACNQGLQGDGLRKG